jgi:GNAT superfamily N-acetyltransferase
MADEIKPEFGLYTPADSGEALALEKTCIQGTSFRMWFKRENFHRRAENFDEWYIYTARVHGRLAGLLGAAIKDVSLYGEALKAVFFFDARTHTDFRNRGISRQMMAHAVAQLDQKVNLGYIYTIADTHIVPHLAYKFGVKDCGGYTYLVYPVFRLKPYTGRFRTAGFGEVHDRMNSLSGSFDFYSNPDCREGKGGYFGSRILESGKGTAGCSIWDNRGILGEVIEAVPLHIRTVGSISALWPVNKLMRPVFPKPGEVVRSWYLFDFHANDPLAGRDLMRAISAEALEHHIDYCYIPHTRLDSWVKALRSDVPRLFSPLIDYRLMLKGFDRDIATIEKLYVDIRDL